MIQIVSGRKGKSKKENGNTIRLFHESPFTFSFENDRYQAFREMLLIEVVVVE